MSSGSLQLATPDRIRNLATTATTARAAFLTSRAQQGMKGSARQASLGAKAILFPFKTQRKLHITAVDATGAGLKVIDHDREPLPLHPPASILIINSLIRLKLIKGMPAFVNHKNGS